MVFGGRNEEGFKDTRWWVLLGEEEECVMISSLAIESNLFSLLLQGEGTNSWRCRDGASHPFPRKASTCGQTLRAKQAGLHVFTNSWDSWTSLGYLSLAENCWAENTVNGTTFFLLLFDIMISYLYSHKRFLWDSVRCHPNQHWTVSSAQEQANVVAEVLSVKSHYKTLDFPCPGKYRRAQDRSCFSFSGSIIAGFFFFKI